MNSDATAAVSLLNAEAVRVRAHRMLDIGLAGRLRHFRIKLENLNVAADLVIETTRAAYPRLDVPLHSRWRHFVFNGENRWAAVDAAANWKDRECRARAAFDLAIISVLLDAGAGPNWHYFDPHSGRRIGRSEGLALVSLRMFVKGAFSSRPTDPLRVDADALIELSNNSLMEGFQITAANALPGIEGRANLLRRLGRVVLSSPSVFGRYDKPRPGALFDVIAEVANGSRCLRLSYFQICCATSVRSGRRDWPSAESLLGTAGDTPH